MFVAHSSVVLLFWIYISSFKAEIIIIECWFEMFLGHMLYFRGQNIRIRNHMLFLPFQYFFFSLSSLFFFNFILLSLSFFVVEFNCCASNRREPFKMQYKTKNFRPRKDQMLPTIVKRAIFHFENSLCSRNVTEIS